MEFWAKLMKPNLMQVFRWLCVGALLMPTGCAKSPAPHQTVNATLSPLGHWNEGLKLAEKRDYASAILEVEAAKKQEDKLIYGIAIAHFYFLNKEYDVAKIKYSALIALRTLEKTLQEKLEQEVARIESAKGKEVTGRSVAGQWLRSTIAANAAQEAIEKQNYKAAYEYYDKAYQYNQDYTLLFESALAASKAKQWDWANKKFKEYMAVGGDAVAKDMAYRIFAETDRIMAILKKQKVVTQKSLADEIYAERSGEEDADGLPPSMLVESTDAQKVEELKIEHDEVPSEKATEQQVDAPIEKKPSEAEEAQLKIASARARKLALKNEKEEKRLAKLEAKKVAKEERLAVAAKKRAKEKQDREARRLQKIENKKRLAKERMVAREAAKQERQAKRQEEEARKKENAANKKALEAKRLAKRERLKEATRAAAMEAANRAEEERMAAIEAKKAAQQERARLKEERRLVILERKREQQARKAELKRQKEEERKQRAEERQQDVQQRKALAKQERLERQDAKRLEAARRQAERDEKKAARQLVLEEKQRALNNERQSEREPKKAKRTQNETNNLDRVAIESPEMSREIKDKRSLSTGSPEAQKKADVSRGALHDSTTTNIETTFEDLLFYAQSKSATVRYRSVHELIPIINDRARIALENRVLNDRNLHVRFAAIMGLVQRDSKASLPVLEHALMAAATSQERAVLKSAISQIRLGQ